MRDVSAVLGEERVEVETRHPARNVAELFADRRGVAIAQLAKFGVDLAAAPAARDSLREFLIARRTDGEALAVVGEHVEVDHLVTRERTGAVELRHHRMCAARVVADHSAEGVARVRGGIGAEGEAVLECRHAQHVEVAPRLDAGGARHRIDREDAIEVLGAVDDHRGVARLAGERGAAAARGDRHAVAAADLDGANHVFGVARQNDADRDVPVVGCVGGPERQRAAIEADFAVDGAFEVGLESRGRRGGHR